jgi:hypothetical protein
VRRKRGDLWRDRSLILHHDNAPAHSSLRVSQFLAGKGISATVHPPYSLTAPADFWLFPKFKSMLKGERFSEAEAIKSMCENFLTFFFRIFKTVLNSGRSAGNILKNWREITLKNSMLLISAALKIHLKE